MTFASNLFSDIPGELPQELFTDLLNAGSVRIERIVSFGHASPRGFWYDQDSHEWILLVQGAARLRFEDVTDTVELTPGSHINIAAHRRHRVEWTDPSTPTVWLAVYYS
jgi:cupin 2 domain-containing protein